jgi:hypothetical protein
VTELLVYTGVIGLLLGMTILLANLFLGLFSELKGIPLQAASPDINQDSLDLTNKEVL